eukprot:9775271-Heterocapsa_arctica.AAC.1
MKRPGDEKLRMDYTESVEQHHRRQKRQQSVDQTSSEQKTPLVYYQEGVEKRRLTMNNFIGDMIG